MRKRARDGDVDNLLEMEPQGVRKRLYPSEIARQQQRQEHGRALAETRTEQKRAFVTALREKATVYSACTAAGISRTQVYAWKREDPEFAQAWADAIADAMDRLAETMYDRAIEERGMPGYMNRVTLLRRHEAGTWIPITQVKRDDTENPVAELARVVQAGIDALLAAGVQPRRRGDPPVIVEGQAQALPPASG